MKKLAVVEINRDELDNLITSDMVYIAIERAAHYYNLPRPLAILIPDGDRIARELNYLLQDRLEPNITEEKEI